MMRMLQLLGVLLLVTHWTSTSVAQPKALEGDIKAQQAAMAFRQGQMSEALRLYGAALADRELNPERRASILTDRGVVRERIGQIVEAVDDFNEAIRLFPEFAAVYNNRGALLVKIGAYQEALKDFDRAIRLAPGYVPAYSNQAGALVKLGQFYPAIELYTAAIRLLPSIVEPLAGRAGAYISAQRPQAALRDLTRAIATDARFSLGYRRRAEAHMILGAYGAAAADLSRAIAFDPSNPEYYLLRGKAYMKGKDPAAAQRDFAKTIELAPADFEAYLERGHAGILLEQFEAAEQDLAKAIELSPRSALSYAYRALMYKKLGQPELGAQEVGKALVLEKENANVFWAKGEVEEAMSRPDQAIEAYRRALTIEPQMQNAIYGLKRLGETVDEDAEDLPSLGFDAWRVHSKASQFFATNEEIGDLKVPLELAGEGSPRILAWEMQEGDFSHIGLLRFSAGKIEVEGTAVDNEFVAIIDTKAQELRGIEPDRQGARQSKWAWGSGRLIVTALDGLTQEYLLREVAPERSVAVQQRRQQPRDQGRSEREWVPWSQERSYGSARSVSQRKPAAGQNRQPQKPKTLFDLLLGY